MIASKQQIDMCTLSTDLLINAENVIVFLRRIFLGQKYSLLLSLFEAVASPKNYFVSYKIKKVFQLTKMVTIE